MLFRTAFYLAWPAVFVALAPLAAAVVATKPWWQAALLAFAAGTVAWAWNGSFLGAYGWTGVWLLAGWHGVTVGLAALSARWWRRRWGVPLAWALPAAWVGAEYLRMLGPCGLPIGPLALPCHRQLWMIQVCDLGGIYALSFAVGMVNGLAADAWLAWHRAGAFRSRSLAAASISTAAVWIGVAGYGFYRLAEADRTVRQGPVLSVIQPDVVYAPGVGAGFDPGVLLEQLEHLSEQATRLRPEPLLIVWPEVTGAVADFNAELLDAPYDEARAAMLFGFGSLAELTREQRTELKTAWQQECEARGEQRTTLARWVTRLGVPVVLGSRCWLPASSGQAEQPWQVYNAAVPLTPDEAGRQRQFKNRLFPLQEWLPWLNTAFGRWLRYWLTLSGQRAPQFYLTPGQGRETFELPREGSPRRAPTGDGISVAPGAASSASTLGPPVRYAVSLCSETLFPQTTASFLRRADGAKAVDLLISLSNQGGFRRNHELRFQSELLPFRAVEARVGVAQSANTGISGFVKPTGAIYGQVTNHQGLAWTGRGAPELPLIADLVAWRNRRAEELRTSPELAAQARESIRRIEHLREEVGVVGQSTQPVYLDSRRTPYGRIHDAFAQLLLAWLAAGLLGLFEEHWTSRRPAL